MTDDLLLGTIFRGVTPVLIAHKARLIVLIIFPSLILWLPAVL